MSMGMTTLGTADIRTDKAKEEKSVLIYGSTQLDQINVLIKRFSQI